MKTIAWRAAFRGVLALAALGLIACGDPETTDNRGYTKAPLEEPGLPVRGEPESVMDELGDPTYPVVKVLEPGDTVQARPATE